jgi:hypothetical protein
MRRWPVSEVDEVRVREHRLAICRDNARVSAVYGCDNVAVAIEDRDFLLTEIDRLRAEKAEVRAELDERHNAGIRMAGALKKVALISNVLADDFRQHILRMVDEWDAIKGTP